MHAAISRSPSGVRAPRLALWLVVLFWVACTAGAWRPRHASWQEATPGSQARPAPRRGRPHRAVASLAAVRERRGAGGRDEPAAPAEGEQPGGPVKEGRVGSGQGNADVDAGASDASGEAVRGGSEKVQEDGEENAHPEQEAYLKLLFGHPDLAWNDYELQLQEKEEGKVGCIVAVLIFGFIMANSTLMYLLNSSDPQIKSYSYKLVSSIIVVFLALSSTSALRGLAHGLCGNSTHATAVVDFVMLALFLGFFFSVRSCASTCRHHPIRRYTLLNVNLHIAAFILFECVGDWQEHTAKTLITGSSEGRSGLETKIQGNANTSIQAVRIHLWLLYILVPLVISVVLWLMSCATTAFFAHGSEHGEAIESHSVQAHGSGAGEHGTSLPNGHESKHEHNDWEHDACHAEADICALAVGFLLKQLIVFATSGMHVAPMDCDESPVECRSDIVRVLLMTGIALFLHCITVFVMHSGSRLEMLLSMTTVWVALHVAQDIATNWILSHVADTSVEHSPTMKNLTTAAMLSPLYILTIVVVDELADRDLLSDVTADECIVALALLTGLFWEKVINSAIEHVSTEMQLGWPISVPFHLMFVIPLAPAWFWFIVPTASQPVPPRADEDGAEPQEGPRADLRGLPPPSAGTRGDGEMRVGHEHRETSLCETPPVLLAAPAVEAS